MNKKAYYAMTPADQQAIRAAFTEGAKVNDELTRANEARLTDFFKTKGVTIVNSDRESFRKKMTSVVEVGRVGAVSEWRTDPGRWPGAVWPCGVRVATDVYSSASARTAAAKASPRAA